MRRLVLPMREVVNSLMCCYVLDEGMVPYYQDVYDHVLRATRGLSPLRDLVTTILETNISIQGNRMNLVMKKVTSWAAIIAVPTAITGFYGAEPALPRLRDWGFWFSTSSSCRSASTCRSAAPTGSFSGRGPAVVDLAPDAVANSVRRQRRVDHLDPLETGPHAFEGLAEQDGSDVEHVVDHARCKCLADSGGATRDVDAQVPRSKRRELEAASKPPSTKLGTSRWVLREVAENEHRSVVGGLITRAIHRPRAAESAEHVGAHHAGRAARLHELVAYRASASFKGSSRCQR